ncbi:MAG: dynamin family protein [Agitococcus sp.]
MKTSQQFIDSLLNSLPQEWHPSISELADNTLQAQQPLRLALVGGFSVGKSSLLNMLLEQKWLFTAKEEATALPTFVEYAETTSMSLIGADHSELPLTVTDFEQVTTQAPEGAICAVLKLPLTWLQNISVIDMPGLGSISQRHEAYTRAQIQQSDAILYLVEPRGPSQSDLQMLQMIRQYGKRVKVLVTRWDEVEAAAQRGEKTPNLEQWANQIYQQTGLKVRLAPVSYEGIGKDDILEFIDRAKEDIHFIRLNRFKAELTPILQNALGINNDQQQACQTQTEEQIRQLHSELIERKQALLELKNQLYAQQQSEQQDIQTQSKQSATVQRQQLQNDLQVIAHDLDTEEAWQSFGHKGGELVNNALATLAAHLCQQSQHYGKPNLPDVYTTQFNLRFPEPSAIEVDSFLEVSKLEQLQQALLNKEQEAQQKQEQLQNFSQDTGVADEEDALRQLLVQRQYIQNQDIAHVVERTGGSNVGSMLGRVFGEVADIGVMFLSPAAIGAKVASVVGKGAKSVNIAVSVKKVASATSKGVKAIQANNKSKLTGVMPPEIVDKVGVLEKFSLAYWGERIGSWLDGAPNEYLVKDPQAVVEQQQALALLDSQMMQLRRELERKEDLANERQLTGWALDQNRQEQARIQADITRLTQQVAERKQQALTEQQEQHQRMIMQYSERAMSQWLRSYDQQADSMQALLVAQVKQYWVNYVEQTLADRIQELDNLQTQIQAAPQQKAQRLAQLQQEAIALQTVIQELA